MSYSAGCSQAHASIATSLWRPPLPRRRSSDQLGFTYATPLVASGLVDAGGEQAEIVGPGAVGAVGDACAQDGDRLGL
jgi:hypothetical protein